jgi:hypothetical protein
MLSETSFPLRQNFSHQYTTLQISYFEITAIAIYHLCQKSLSDNKINTLFFLNGTGCLKMKILRYLKLRKG